MLTCILNQGIFHIFIENNRLVHNLQIQKFWGKLEAMPSIKSLRRTVVPWTSFKVTLKWYLALYRYDVIPTIQTRKWRNSSHATLFKYICASIRRHSSFLHIITVEIRQWPWLSKFCVTDVLVLGSRFWITCLGSVSGLVNLWFLHWLSVWCTVNYWFVALPVPCGSNLQLVLGVAFPRLFLISFI